MAKKSLPFVRFVNLLEILKSQSPNEKALHHDVDALLAYLYQADQAGTVVSMTALVQQQRFGAPPTIQRRVKELLAAGLIETFDGVDKRQRCLRLTNQGQDYLQKCSEMLCQAMSGHPCGCTTR